MQTVTKDLIFKALNKITEMVQDHVDERLIEVDLSNKEAIIDRLRYVRYLVEEL